MNVKVEFTLEEAKAITHHQGTDEWRAACGKLSAAIYEAEASERDEQLEQRVAEALVRAMKHPSNNAEEWKFTDLARAAIAAVREAER